MKYPCIRAFGAKAKKYNFARTEYTNEHSRKKKPSHRSFVYSRICVPAKEITA